MLKRTNIVCAIVVIAVLVVTGAIVGPAARAQNGLAVAASVFSRAGPKMIDVDLGLAKVFQIRERLRLRFEASFTNALNRVNFAPPVTNISNPTTFGVLQAVLPQGAGGNRVGQVSLRLDF